MKGTADNTTMFRSFIEKVEQQINDERFIANVPKYLTVYRKYIPISRNDVMFIINTRNITPTKYGFQAEIEDIWDTDKNECVFTGDYIDYFDDNKVVYNQLYLSEGIVNQIDRSKTRAVLRVGVELKTFKRGKEIYQAHPIKVVNPNDE